MIWVRGLKPRQRAINDCVDRKDGKNELATFRNIMNEWYAKDTSNKIKAVFKSRMKDGLRCSGSIPYGYKREPGDKQTLIVDEPAAEVVRKIFRLVCQGVTTTGIAEILTKEKVLIPSAYAAISSCSVSVLLDRLNERRSQCQEKRK